MGVKKAATVVRLIIEVPVMLMLVKICLKTAHWFPQKDLALREGHSDD
jgi:ACR3 family arsenite efflux pump ArsB